MMEKGTVTYRSKFLESDTYNANSIHTRIVILEFGTLALPDPCKNVFECFMSKFELPAVTDKTSVNYVQYKGDYYISSETNFMNKVDIATLEKSEKVDWSKFIAVNGATTHLHYDSDGTVYNMGNSYGPRGMTKNYMIIIEKPLKMNLWKIITSKIQGKSFSDGISWEPQYNSRFYVVDKHTGQLLPGMYYTVNLLLLFIKSMPLRTRAVL